MKIRLLSVITGFSMERIHAWNEAATGKTVELDTQGKSWKCRKAEYDRSSISSESINTNVNLCD